MGLKMSDKISERNEVVPPHDLENEKDIAVRLVGNQVIN